MPDMRKSQEPISVSPIPTPEQMTSVQPAATEQARLRNFCIIAHIDHGKSTLADRMLQATGVVQPRDMRAQYLDRMDIERERGITIKSQAVRMPWAIEGDDGVTRAYALNMIDTPGHVDFSYEVNRSLAACEGAVLLVDAAQGIQAQTLANLYMAIEGDLTIIPVLNKIDLPAAEPEKHAEEIASLIGCDVDDVLKVSGKTGQGVPELLDRIVEIVPPPHGDPEAPARAWAAGFTKTSAYLPPTPPSRKKATTASPLRSNTLKKPIPTGCLCWTVLPPSARKARRPKMFWTIRWWPKRQLGKRDRWSTCRRRHPGIAECVQTGNGSV